MNNRYNNNLIFGDLPKVEDTSAFKTNKKFMMDSQFGQPQILDQYNTIKDPGATIDKRLHIRSSSFKEFPQSTINNNYQPLFNNTTKYSNQIISTMTTAPIYKTHSQNFPNLQLNNESSLKSSMNSGFPNNFPAYKSKYSVNVSDIKCARPVNTYNQSVLNSGQKDYNRKTFFNVH